MANVLTQVRTAGVWLIEHQPAIVFNAVSMVTTLAAKYGLKLDSTELLGVIAVVFGGSTLATKSKVWSTAGHFKEVDSVAAVTAAVTENKIYASLPVVAPAQPTLVIPPSLLRDPVVAAAVVVPDAQPPPISYEGEQVFPEQEPPASDRVIISQQIEPEPVYVPGPPPPPEPPVTVVKLDPLPGQSVLDVVRGAAPMGDSGNAR